MTNKQKIFSWGLACAMLLSAVPVFADSVSFSPSSSPNDARFAEITWSYTNVSYLVVFAPGATRPTWGAAVDPSNHAGACGLLSASPDMPISNLWLGTTGSFAVSPGHDYWSNGNNCPWSSLGTWTVGIVEPDGNWSSSGFDFTRVASGGSSSVFVPWDKPQNDFSASTTAAATSSLQIVQQRCIWIDASTSECVSTSTVPTGLTVNDVNFLVMLGTFFSTVLFFGKVLGFS